MNGKVEHPKLFRPVGHFHSLAWVDEQLRRETRKVVLGNIKKHGGDVTQAVEEGTVKQVVETVMGFTKNEKLKVRLTEWALNGKGGWLSRQEKKEAREDYKQTHPKPKKAELRAAVKAKQAEKKVSDVWLSEGLRRAHVPLVQLNIPKIKDAADKGTTPPPSSETPPGDQNSKPGTPDTQSSPPVQNPAPTAKSTPTPTATATPTLIANGEIGSAPTPAASPQKSNNSPSTPATATPTPISTPTPTSTATPSPTPVPVASPPPNPNSPLSPKSRKHLYDVLANYNKNNPNVKPEAIEKALSVLEQNADRRGVAVADSNGKKIGKYFLKVSRFDDGRFISVYDTLARWYNFKKDFVQTADGAIVEAQTYVKVAPNLENFKSTLGFIEQMRDRVKMPSRTALTDEQQKQRDKNLNETVELLKKNKRIGVYDSYWCVGFNGYAPLLGGNDKHYLEVHEKNGQKYLERVPTDGLFDRWLENVEGEGIYVRQDPLLDQKLPFAKNMDELQACLTDLLNQPVADKGKSETPRKRAIY